MSREKRYLICALLETLPDLELLAAVAHRRRRRRDALLPPLHGETVARRRERACRQCMDGDQGEQHVVAVDEGALLERNCLRRAAASTNAKLCFTTSCQSALDSNRRCGAARAFLLVSYRPLGLSLIHI